MSRGDVCSMCRFWQENPKTDDTGECRRHPPSVHIVQISTLTAAAGAARAAPVAVFPPTSATSWCGEFQPPIDDDKTPPARPRAA